jgi:hypothetical protein
MRLAVDLPARSRSSGPQAHHRREDRPWASGRSAAGSRGPGGIEAQTWQVTDNVEAILAKAIAYKPA